MATTKTPLDATMNDFMKPIPADAGAGEGKRRWQLWLHLAGNPTGSAARLALYKLACEWPGFRRAMSSRKTAMDADTRYLSDLALLGRVIVAQNESGETQIKVCQRLKIKFGRFKTARAANPAIWRDMQQNIDIAKTVSRFEIVNKEFLDAAKDGSLDKFADKTDVSNYNE